LGDLGSHEIWVSDEYEQDYADPSERCFVGVAPATAGEPFVQYCNATGRHIRLVLPGEARSLTIEKMEVLGAAPAIYLSGEQLAEFGTVAPVPSTAVLGNGASASVCVDGQTTFSDVDQQQQQFEAELQIFRQAMQQELSIPETQSVWDVLRANLTARAGNQIQTPPACFHTIALSLPLTHRRTFQARAAKLACALSVATTPS
jgi:hypothetical protein